MAYVDVTDPVLVAAESDVTKRTDAINAGAKTIDTHLGGRWVVPVVVASDAELNSFLESINRSLALYLLSHGSAGTGRKTAKDYSEAMRQLKSLQSGKGSLPGAVPATTGVSGTVAAVGASGTVVGSTFTSKLFEQEDQAL